MFGLIAWDYREDERRLAPYDHLWRMGLYDLQRTRDGELERIPTAVAEAFRAAAEQTDARPHVGGQLAQA
jgi:hypothetical protein